MRVDDHGCRYKGCRICLKAALARSNKKYKAKLKRRQNMSLAELVGQMLEVAFRRAAHRQGW